MGIDDAASVYRMDEQSINKNANGLMRLDGAASEVPSSSVAALNVLGLENRHLRIAPSLQGFAFKCSPAETVPFRLPVSTYCFHMLY